MKMEYRQREIEGEHAKMIDELTKKLQESEKRCEDIVEKNRASQQETEELLTKVHQTLEAADTIVVGLSEASKGIVSERVNHAELKEKACKVIGDFLQELETIKADFVSTTDELVSAKKMLAVDQGIQDYLNSQLRHCEVILEEHNGPGWRNLLTQLDRVQTENRTLRMVMRNRTST